MSALIHDIPLDALPGAMIKVDTHGRIQNFNRVADKAMRGLIVGESLVNRLDAKAGAFLTAILAGEEQSCEDFLEFEACVDDRRFLFTVGLLQIADAQFLVQISDITEFREISNQLKESEQRYRSLFLEHPDAVFSLDLNGRFREVNRRTTELTGYEYEQLLGYHWETVVIEEDRDAVHRHFQQVLEGHSSSFSCRITDHGGRDRVAEVINVPMIVDGNVVGVFGIAQDRTEHYRLEEQQRLLETSMAQIRDVIMITETQPLEEPGPRIVFVNESVERLTGYHPDELLGRSPRIFQGVDTDSAARRRIREALKAHQPIKEVLLNYRKDGTAFWNELEIVPLDSCGTTGRDYFAAVQHDITQRKQRELKLQRSQQALRRLYNAQEGVREEERRRIARDLHDDLGQMLTSMKFYLGRIIHELPQLPEPHGKRLDEVVGFADEVIEKVREIAANLRPAILDDLGFEAAAEWFLEQCANRYQLEVRWRPGPGVAGRTSSEIATALFRMLQECLTNVRRHANASCVTVRYDEYDNRAWLLITDNGMGFNPQLPQEPGIGLAGMSERVSMLGGSLEIESSKGKGAEISITLPLENSNHD